MAKKTTSNSNTEPSESGAPKRTPSAKPAKKAMADLAGSVKRKIKETLAPKGAGRKQTRAPIIDTPPSTPAIETPASIAAPPSVGENVARELSSQPEAKVKRTTRGTAAAKAQAGAKSNGKTSSPHYTQDDVALRAYFLSEQRVLTGRPGDPENDWIEAERQLAAEAKKGLAPR